MIFRVISRKPSWFLIYWTLQAMSLTLKCFKIHPHKDLFVSKPENARKFIKILNLLLHCKFIVLRQQRNENEQREESPVGSECKLIRASGSRTWICMDGFGPRIISVPRIGCMAPSSSSYLRESCRLVSIKTYNFFITVKNLVLAEYICHC